MQLVGVRDRIRTQICPRATHMLLTTRAAALPSHYRVSIMQSWLILSKLCVAEFRDFSEVSLRRKASLVNISSYGPGFFGVFFLLFFGFFWVPQCTIYQSFWKILQQTCLTGWLRGSQTYLRMEHIFLKKVTVLWVSFRTLFPRTPTWEVIHWILIKSCFHSFGLK